MEYEENTYHGKILKQLQNFQDWFFSCLKDSNSW